MNSLTIFPYSAEYAPLARHMGLLNEYGNVNFVSPPGLGITGLNASSIDGGHECGQTIASDLDSAMSISNALLLSGTIRKVDINYLHAIALRYCRDKTVYLSSSLKHSFLQSGLSIPTDCNELKYQDLDIPTHKTKEPFLPINVPVIYIAGAGEFCRKFDMQLHARAFFQANGYKVAQLGTKEYSSLFGFESLPRFLFDSIRPINKALAFNRYIRDMVLREKPDVLLLGVPGGILPLTRRWPEYLGELAYVMMEAVPPDALSLNIYSQKEDAQFFRNIDNCCLYRYGIIPSCYVLSGTKFILKRNEPKPIQYIPHQNDIVWDFSVEHAEKRVFTVDDVSSCNAMLGKIIEDLAANIAIL